MNEISMMAEEILLKYNHIPTTGFVVVPTSPSGYEIMVIDCAFNNDKDKFLKVMFLKSLAQKFNADAVAWASEAWFSINPPGQEYVRPSESPNKKEALIVTAVTPAYQCVAVQEIKVSPTGKRYLWDNPNIQWADEGDVQINLLSDIWPPTTN